MKCLDEYVQLFLTGFLNVEDKYILSQTSKYYKRLINLPKHCAKTIHFQKLQKKYSVQFLFHCVQNYSQAIVFYQSVDSSILRRCMLESKDRYIRSMFRNIMYKDHARKLNYGQSPNTKRVRMRKPKLLKVQ